MSVEGIPAAERVKAPQTVPPAGPNIARSSGPRLTPLPRYDVRVRRELAHRRFVVSVVRQIARLVTLHAVDAVAVATAFYVARSLSDVPPAPSSFGAVLAFVLIGLNLRGSYRAGDARRDAKRLVTGVGIAAVLVALPIILPRDLGITGEFVGIFALSAVAALIVERRIVNAIVHQAYMRGFGLRRALILTRSHELKDLLAGLDLKDDNRPAEDQVIVGYVTPDPRFRDSDALGSIVDLERVLDGRDVSELLVATALPNDRLAQVAQACFERGVRLLVISQPPQASNGWAELTRVGSWPAYQLHPPRLELPALILKRVTDLLLSTLGLVIAAPLILIIAIAIKIETRGPVFFRQKRVGLGGREFMMWKFRSMTQAAEAQQATIAHLNAYEDARLFKLPRDPRITRVGRFLRRFSLDELPQLLNILANDMSLVGPRPPLPSEVTRYENHHYIRLSVVPGLTGPWQVNGRNLITNFEEVVRLEREYIEHWSLRSDIEIMIRTLGVVLSGKGAY